MENKRGKIREIGVEGSSKLLEGGKKITQKTLKMMHMELQGKITEYSIEGKQINFSNFKGEQLINFDEKGEVFVNLYQLNKLGLPARMGIDWRGNVTLNKSKHTEFKTDPNNAIIAKQVEDLISDEIKKASTKTLIEKMGIKNGILVNINGKLEKISKEDIIAISTNSSKQEYIQNKAQIEQKIQQSTNTNFSFDQLEKTDSKDLVTKPPFEVFKIQSSNTVNTQNNGTNSKNSNELEEKINQLIIQNDLIKKQNEAILAKLKEKEEKINKLEELIHNLQNENLDLLSKNEELQEANKTGEKNTSQKNEATNTSKSATELAKETEENKEKKSPDTVLFTFKIGDQILTVSSLLNEKSISNINKLHGKTLTQENAKDEIKNIDFVYNLDWKDKKFIDTMYTWRPMFNRKNNEIQQEFQQIIIVGSSGDNTWKWNEIKQELDEIKNKKKETVIEKKKEEDVKDKTEEPEEIIQKPYSFSDSVNYLKNIHPETNRDNIKVQEFLKEEIGGEDILVDSIDLSGISEKINDFIKTANTIEKINVIKGTANTSKINIFSKNIDFEELLDEELIKSFSIPNYNITKETIKRLENLSRKN